MALLTTQFTDCFGFHCFDAQSVVVYEIGLGDGVCFM